MLLLPSGFKLKVAEAPSEIKALFNDYSEQGVMSLEQLQKFLIEVQGEDEASMEDVQGIMDSLHEFKHLPIFQLRKGLNLEAFFRYLCHDLNPPLSPHNTVHHDMNAPLSHYFIYTGHNSYLTGNQLSSICSDVPVINSLQCGVRVIELDMWPNSTKDDIDVLHGRTLTTPVKLSKCLISIKKYAFVASEYPVIITLEDHLTPDLQAKVAEMATQIFGDLLFSPESECLAEFPSPESLKRQIIISTKPPKEYLETKIKDKDEGSQKETASIQKKDNGSQKATKSAKKKDNGSQKAKYPSEDKTWGKEISDLKDELEPFDKDEPEEGEDINEEDMEDWDHKLQQSAAPEYRRLIAIQAGKQKGGIKEWIRLDPDKVRRLSLSEQELENAIITHGQDIIRFTQRNLLRVFPKVMRGYDRPLWLMQGMFRANGGCGYVKKPDLLLKVGPHDKVFDPKANLPVKTTLKVKVYMGEGWHLDFHHTHFDIYSPPDFYTKSFYNSRDHDIIILGLKKNRRAVNYRYLQVGIAGVPADSLMKKTKAVEDDWTPTWNEEFEFPLTAPELALLRIEVHEYDMSEKDDFGGQTCLPVSELRTGIRAVPLHNQKGEKYNSVKLLMRFEFV
ncbi:Phosphoinositide phospholipase C 2 [Vitis vinifera]|uniref:Phosphoinositide phospholipase C n=1 Tax=Vitis vinifera TaxID=29760 RepID=A0A438E9X0_VITVI|nr:Phosphoinositide phospholipase C 2 [Vitis vinifera]